MDIFSRNKLVRVQELSSFGWINRSLFPMLPSEHLIEFGVYIWCRRILIWILKPLHGFRRSHQKAEQHTWQQSYLSLSPSERAKWRATCFPACRSGKAKRAHPLSDAVGYPQGGISRRREYRGRMYWHQCRRWWQGETHQCSSCCTNNHGAERLHASHWCATPTPAWELPCSLSRSPVTTRTD